MPRGSSSVLAATTAATPIVDVALRIGGARRVVGLKLEGFNPGGSIKARTAASLVASLESDGLLRPGDTLVESTSGNLGVALALICAQRGYSFVAVVDPKIDPSVIDRMRAANAEIVMVDEPDAGGGYLLTRLAEVRRLMAQRRMVWPNQYENAANPAAHFDGTGPELLAQRPDLDAVFIATSTGGTLAGVSRYLRTARPKATVVAVDVHGSQTFAGNPAHRLLNGIGSSRPSSFLTPADYDRVVFVSDREAIAACHTLEARTQISVGGSSGAALAACGRVLAEAPELRRAVCICPDDGANYRQTIFSPRWLAAHDVTPIDDASMLAFTDARVRR
jgi:2,3-diaminopropionate biosynthesis protein SbnA